jgi:modulator of FtsH protease
MYAENNHLIYSRLQYIGITILMILIIFLMFFVKSMIIKFILFCLFSSLVGLLLSNELDTNNPEEAELAKKALITTIIIFVYIVLFGFFLVFLGIKIPYQISIALFIILLLVIIAIFITTITKTYPLYRKAISGFIIFLFSVFIGYDTINMMQKDYNGDFISASMDYFLDILELFVNVENLS